MVQQKAIDSFFKRKRDDPVVEQDQPSVPRVLPLPAPMIELEGQRQRQGEEQQANETVVFRGIEFLERDPAKRPQIWEYPSNQQDEVRRAYLKLGPMQPKLKNYKPSGPQGHQRRFQYNWFSEFPSWLEYSESSGCAYCLLCFVSSKNIKKRSGFDVFTAQGFDSWNKVDDNKNCAFLVHIGSDPCSQHNNAVKECHTLLTRPNHIENIMEATSDREKERNRLRLKTSIAAVKWLTFQSCAFRGHDETPESKNRGNFVEMCASAGLGPEVSAPPSSTEAGAGAGARTTPTAVEL